MTNKVIHGDNLEVLKTYPENFFHSVVTDPPYGLKFMNKHWDYDVPKVEFWREVLRVLKPGGYVLSFGGTRTYHRMVVNIEDAGFIIRDQLQWIYGQGFPKSLNIGKAVDKLQGNEREEVEAKWNCVKGDNEKQKGCLIRPGGKFQESKGSSEWEGYGTALKPANEPICLAMKPLSEKNFAENVLKHGAGGLNIDGCRVGSEGGTAKGTFPNEASKGIYGNGLNGSCEIESIGKGRFPSNVILDEEAGAMLNGQSRFFYSPKASSSERNAGMRWDSEREEVTGQGLAGENNNPGYKNHHATVKPLSLMRYLVRLITPKGGIVLEPFAGSGTTLLAAKKESLTRYRIKLRGFTVAW